MIRIAIIGMGLIGSSLGMALRAADSKKDPMGELEVVGYDANTANTKEARGRLAIDKVANTVAEAVAGAHLVVLAVPAQAMRTALQSIAPHLSAGTVVTDVTSTKAMVSEWARELLPAANSFIGGHPMAGREKSGPKAATSDLFKDAVYCLCPTNTTPGPAINLCEALVERIGAKVYFIDPVEHDAYVAGISHLPFVLAATIVKTTVGTAAGREMGALAATGFRDMTRLASGDVTMHRDIVMTNRDALARWIDDTTAELNNLKEKITAGDEAAITQFFADAHKLREEWLTQKPGMRPGEAEYQDMGVDQVQRPSLFGSRSGGRK
jgi:prephenate dehydrogenase